MPAGRDREEPPKPGLNALYPVQVGLRITLLACLITIGCSSGPTSNHGSARPSSPPPAWTLPAGYTAYDGGQMGFRFGLAPGWREAGHDPQGLTFSDPGLSGSMLVHFEGAQASDLQVAAAQLLTELTGGIPAASNRMNQDSRLAGLPARRVGGTYQLLSSQQRVETIVTLDGPRVWAFALVAPPDAFEADRADFDRMAATFALTTTQPSPPARAALGLPAPTFDLVGPAGRVALERVRGPVVLNFFATWCGPCRQEMPLLASRAAASGNRFTVLGVDTHDDTSAVPAFLRELGVSFAVAYDADGGVADRYQLPGVPGTFFLDAGHVLRKSVLGPLTADSLQQGLLAAGAA